MLTTVIRRGSVLIFTFRYVEIIKDKERNSGRRKFTKKNKNSDGAGDASAGSKKKKQKT